MKCIKCGNEISEGTKFCPNCGAENVAPNVQEEVVANPVVEPQPVEGNEPIPPIVPEQSQPEPKQPIEHPRPEPTMSVVPPRPINPINNVPDVPPQPKEGFKKSHNKVYIIIIAILSLVIVGLVCVLIFGEDWGIMCNDSSSTRETDKSDSKDKDTSSKDQDDDQEEKPSEDPEEDPSVETKTQKVVCTQYFDDYSGTYTFSAINNEIIGLEIAMKFSYEDLGLNYETLTPEDREAFIEGLNEDLPESQVGVQVTTEFNPSTIDIKLNIDFTTADPNSLKDILDFDGTEDMNLERVIERAKADGAICY